MEIPSRPRPTIEVANGVIRVTRGYEVATASGALVFVGAHDGPQLKVEARGGAVMQMPVDMAAELWEAMQMALRWPVAEVGAADAELEAMGYRRL
jgi:hypothetical protein